MVDDALEHSLKNDGTSGDRGLDNDEDYNDGSPYSNGEYDNDNGYGNNNHRNGYDNNYDSDGYDGDDYNNNSHYKALATMDTTPDTTMT